jgi:protein-S-isoprenylcysteine O-methyltransferase Ste14
MAVTLYWKVAIWIWVAWFTTWWIAALFRDRRTVEAPRSSWRGQFMDVVVGLWGLFFQARWLPGPLWHTGPALGWTTVGVTTLAFAFAWWARLTMGRLWSGGVERTETHEVIQRGPFAWVRHPIYTALSAAGLALALIAGTPTSLAGAALFTLGWYLKARVEEGFLTEQLSGYPEYRARVPMLVPWRLPSR